jgi:glycosyltransferase involved in cell wall biosynthesis
VGDVFGEERAWLKREIEEKELHNTITITGWLPYEKVSEAMNACHAGLILFRDCMNNRLAGPPNKLFNYMNAGLPVLSVDFPELRQIILEEECGILIYDQSVKSIIDAIETLLTNPENLNRMSKNGQRAVRERYSWDVMEKKLLYGYERLSRMAC